MYTYVCIRIYVYEPAAARENALLALVPADMIERYDAYACACAWACVCMHV